MKKLWQKYKLAHKKPIYKKYIYIYLLLVLCIVISAKNYTPNTFLTGWDNLHPEFNFALNIKRSFSVLWQEYQGLGLLAGMAHAADLPRQFILYALSSMLPINILRYLWTFSMLFVGSWGAMELTNFMFKKIKIAKKDRQLIGGFIAGIIYILNLATLQTFFVPYDTFVSFFGFLPWLILWPLIYLRFCKKVDLYKTFIVLFLSTSAFHVQTFFVVYIILLSLFIAEDFFKNRQIKNYIALGAVILASQAFWLLPASYFYVSSASDVVLTSKINTISTPETQLMNQGFSSINNIIQLKGFWLEYSDVQSSQFSFLMPFWREYVTTNYFIAIAYIVFVLSILGSVWHFIKTKSPILPVTIFICMAMISAGKGELGFVFNVVEKIVPLFGQVFRSPFTKWSNALSLFIAIGIGVLINSIGNKFAKYLVSVVLIIMVGFQMYPVVNGRLISDNMRLKTPPSYFEMFEFFDNAPKEKRIAFFPIQSFWGWNFYSWHYRGSGFIWYGIEQPILDRAFDVWNSKNESFYQEFSAAFYTKDANNVKKVLNKYDVSYIIVDNNVVTPYLSEPVLKTEKFENYLNILSAKKVFEKDNLAVYEIEHESNIFAKTPSKFHSLNINLDKVKNDIYFDNQTSLVSSKKAEIAYPFSTLLTQNPKVNIENDFEGNSYLSIRSDISASNLAIPALNVSNQYSTTAKISYFNNRLTLSFLPPYQIYTDGQLVSTDNIFKDLFFETDEFYEQLILSIGGKFIEVRQGSSEYVDGILLSTDKVLTVDVFSASSKKQVIDGANYLSDQIYNNCWERTDTNGNFEVSLTSESISITTQDMVACAAEKLGNFSDTSLLEVSLTHKSFDQARPHFCVVEEGSSECIHDEIFFRSSPSSDWQEISSYMLVSNTTPYWMILAGRPPEQAGRSWTIEYQAPEISVYDRVLSFNYSPELWSEFRTTQIINLPKYSELEVKLPVSKVDIDFSQNSLFDQPNCDLFKRGNGAKLVLSEDNIIYTAADRGASCDFQITRGVYTDREYILQINAQNNAGRSFKMYMNNPHTKFNDIETLLPNVTNYFSVFNTLNQNQDEYTIGIETRSFGGEKTSNELSKVSFYDVNLSWLSSWKLFDGNELDNIQSNNIKILNSKKTLTYYYKVEIEKTDEGEGLLELSQSYDSAWVGFIGFNKLAHFEVDSWKNGWIITDQECEVGEVCTVTIFYLPQILEWIGFGMLMASFIFLTYRSRQI